MILITGHHGLIGSALMRSLKGSRVGLEKTATFDAWQSELEALMDQHDFTAVVHAGAISDNQYKGNDIFDWNARCTNILANLCAKGNIYLIYFSSQTARNPSTPYGFSKQSAELFIKEKPNLKVCILQPFNIWGDDESMKPVHCRSLPYRLATHELPVLWDTYRDYVHVSDVVRVVKSALKYQLTGTFHVGSTACVKSGTLASLADYDGYRFEARPPHIAYETRAELSKLIPNWFPRVDVRDFQARIGNYHDTAHRRYYQENAA